MADSQLLDWCTNLTGPLRDVVTHREYLLGLLVKKKAVVTEMNAAHVPMKILGLQMKRKNIGEELVVSDDDPLEPSNSSFHFKTQSRLGFEADGAGRPACPWEPFRGQPRIRRNANSPGFTSILSEITSPRTGRQSYG